MLMRRKGESADERKARKAAVKEARRSQRSAKKEVRVSQRARGDGRGESLFQSQRNQGGLRWIQRRDSGATHGCCNCVSGDTTASA